MIFENSLSFSLENFEGPLELLFYLIQREEVDICEIALKELTRQFEKGLQITKEIDVNADLLGLAATLLLMKSQKLLPPGEMDEEENGADPRMQMIQQLIEYCRFKDAAQELSKREATQQAFFPRGLVEPSTKKPNSGLEELNLNELKTLLKDLMTRLPTEKPHLIQDEPWPIDEKIIWFRKELKKRLQIPFDEIFREDKCRSEIIVLFLALLELMKAHELHVVMENALVYIISHAARS